MMVCVGNEMDSIGEGQAHEAYTHVPAFNPEEYRRYVEEFDITEEQKDELLRILWSIAVAFVDLGFGVDAVQRILPGLSEISSPPESRALEKNQQDFNVAASDNANKDGEDDQ